MKRSFICSCLYPTPLLTKVYIGPSQDSFNSEITQLMDDPRTFVIYSFIGYRVYTLKKFLFVDRRLVAFLFRQEFFRPFNHRSRYG